MNSWNQAPLLRLLFPFLIGITAAIFFPFQSSIIFPLLIVLVISVSTIILIPKFNISYRKSVWFGLLTNTVFFVIAYHLTILKTQKFADNHFSKLSHDKGLVYAQITEPTIEKSKSLKVVVDVLVVKQDGKWTNTCGKAIVYFQKNTRAFQLKYGDRVVLYADFKEIQAPQNPGEFNYKQFLSFHNIYHQAFIKNDNWIYSGKNSGNFIKKAAIDFRDALLEVLTKNNVKGNEFAVGSALLLGYEDKLDADIISAYSNTGALHILSVSGLHVAIVYLVFNWLLSFFDKLKYGIAIKAFLLILLLWSYALVTGLSPSVLRAATMLSFIVIAKAYNMHTNIYNTLAASAFLLLLIDPFLLMDVGFQLSYIAVIGIVYIQPKIQEWYEPSTIIMSKAWIIISGSIAAQIATFPLALYYFHQFPNYFLLSNLIVIPVSTAVIYLGIALLLFSKLSLLAGLSAMGFNSCVWFLNQTVMEIEKWPYALISNISITLLETSLIYCFIFLMFTYIAKMRFRFLFISIVIFTLIIGLQLNEQIQQNKQRKIIVYNIPKISAFDFISNKKNVLFCDSTFAKNEMNTNFRLKNNWAGLGIDRTEIIHQNSRKTNLFIKDNFVQFYDKKMIVIDERFPSKKINIKSIKPLSVDYVIISKNKKITMAEVLVCFQTKMVVFDSSNPQYRIEQLKSECENLKQACYSVAESGAFVVDM